MSYKATNYLWDKVTIPDATDGSNSRSFSIPHHAKSVTIHLPDFVGAATTAKVQALRPQENDQAAETWTDVTVFDLTDGTFEALYAFPESTVVTLPVTALGGGIFRFVTSAAQTGAADALTIYLGWGMEG